MTNYEEEQQYEVEALESIYPDSFTIVSSNPTAFTLQIATEEDILPDVEVDDLCVTLKFTYTSKYPDEGPLFEVTDEVGFQDEEVSAKLEEVINDQIEENMGTVMVFTIMSAVQEFLNETRDKTKKGIKDEEERKEREIKEAEERKCAGTKVTVASFLEWKTEFDRKMLEIENKMETKEKQSKKLTGKEYFIQNNIDDDSALLEGEEAVEVDESLFEEMEDLDLDDDEFNYDDSDS